MFRVVYSAFNCESRQGIIALYYFFYTMSEIHIKESELIIH